MLFSPLLIAEKLLFYYRLSFGLKGVKVKTLEATTSLSQVATEAQRNAFYVWMLTLCGFNRRITPAKYCIILLGYLYQWCLIFLLTLFYQRP